MQLLKFQTYQQFSYKSNLSSFQASDRVQLNLTALKSSVSKNNFKDLSSIAKDLVENEGIVATRPLGF